MILMMFCCGSALEAQRAGTRAAANKVSAAPLQRLCASSCRPHPRHLRLGELARMALRPARCSGSRAAGLEAARQRRVGYLLRVVSLEPIFQIGHDPRPIACISVIKSAAVEVTMHRVEMPRSFDLQEHSVSSAGRGGWWHRVCWCVTHTQGARHTAAVQYMCM